MPAERRRAARFDASLWVGIPEAEGEPELESCNISASGMLLRTSRDAGAPGAVRMLRLVTAELVGSIEIMAHVIRVIAYDDVVLGRVIEATVFEFLAHGDKHRREFEDFLRQVVEAEFSSAPSASVNYHFPARIPARMVWPAALLRGDRCLSGMVITDCAVEAGARVQVEIELPSSSRALRLSGRAVGSRPVKGAGEDERHCVQVSFGDGGELRDEAAEDFGDDVNTLVSEELSSEGSSRQNQGVHLSGTLSEVGMPGLLGFFELERASGVLRLERDSSTAAVFVREGCILDVESEPAGPSAIDALADLLAWPDGAFEFTFQSVDRADAIGRSTTALLMECAQRSDESSRQP
jgi:hypothetical protein